MKNVVFLISLVHLLLAFSSSTSARTTPNPLLHVVYDTNGDILRTDARYFVVVAPKFGAGGGVTRGPWLKAGYGAGDANFVCPSLVVQSPLDADKGVPVFFKPKAPKQVEITESTPLNIRFYNPIGVCNNTLWEVEGYPGTSENPAFLSTNGKTGNPSTWFQIKKFNDELNAYRFVFCPIKETCDEIVINHFKGQRLLTVRFGYRFPVVFVKDTHYGINSII
ncbi:miraculin-like [Lycium barbarum]|uniref:miraculin-like n=1 Tax=Lycium barbarum TaxID=112863 RepID=UPI00293F1E53|nr:miraculin-like [Lycium barbarum]